MANTAVAVALFTGMLESLENGIDVNKHLLLKVCLELPDSYTKQVYDLALKGAFKADAKDRSKTFLR